ncbi:DNA mismatch repair protein MutS [Gordonia sp. TBRC 11910]|uniref:DNA mismatch repair protein MutS n=1 Tax=Gordonia asplenii TaxID=2725283 RepID=A0A848L219_9ACTN|nr:DNA mismatch repair protein MutS [Gordonia asplenii]NMO04482.1 DNA mismatch repair protein MutS [Gordonia asplenii]
MNTRLLFADHDVDLDGRAPDGAGEVIRDLGLQPIIHTMADEDAYLHGVVAAQLLAMQTDLAVITYRHAGIDDALMNVDSVRDMYQRATAALDELRHHALAAQGRVGAEHHVRRSLAIVSVLSEHLRSLVAQARSTYGSFTSPAFGGFCSRLAATFDEQYLAELRAHLRELDFEHGILLSARLADGGQSTDYAVRTAVHHSVVQRARRRSAHFRLDPDDVHAGQILDRLRTRALHRVAGALADSAAELQRFFQALRYETAFYLGAINLHRALRQTSAPVCYPQPKPVGSQVFTCRNLCDAGLVLSRRDRVVGNDVVADGAALIMITGANQGGKSTFLRSVGAAQLMMQAGLPVTATSMAADVRTSLATHFTREEDVTSVSGKLDEELARLSRIVDGLTPASLLLFNESFASTNEREGATIAAGIVAALTDAGHRVLFVTHMYELAAGFYAAGTGLFLRAERTDAGERTFRILTGSPRPTSYGADLYREIFGTPG